MNIRWHQASRKARTIGWIILATTVVAIGWINFTSRVETFALDRSSSCLLKVVTGVPCIACRGTRASFALANGDFAKSFLFNPLVPILAVGVIFWIGLVAFLGKYPSFHASRPFRILGWLIFSAALIGNWIYVVASGG